MKVWLVESNCFDETELVGVCATKERAEDLRAKDIEEFKKIKHIISWDITEQEVIE